MDLDDLCTGECSPKSELLADPWIHRGLLRDERVVLSFRLTDNLFALSTV